MTEQEIPKILVVAEGEYPSKVDSMNYTEISKEDGQNIAEYDVVIVDLTGMDLERAKTLQESPLFGMKRIHDHLWARHDLILILDKQYVNSYSSSIYTVKSKREKLRKTKLQRKLCKLKEFSNGMWIGRRF